MTLAVSRLLARTRAQAGAPPAYARAVVAAAAGGATTTTGGRGHCRRLFSAEAVARPVQVYVSRSHDPFLNLSLEHYLLQKSAPESVVLFLYTNRPCVVIGRNQNPWREVDPVLFNGPVELAPLPGDHTDREIINGIDYSNWKMVDLVRRRSGGGTVFHDYGNVNYSVLCPPAAFDRNKHAEMVVRALRGLGVATARVNERHDIVVSVDTGNDDAEGGSSSSSSFKVSGSAYKLTRLRSLHHGTCLLSSPNLDRIGRLLSSPLVPYLKGRGVESVRSPIRNVGLPSAAFEDAVVAEFAALYGRVAVETVGGGDEKDLLERLPDEVAKGYAELKSPEWIYTQTPQFTFSVQPSDEDPRARPEIPECLSDFHLSFTVRHGQITQAHGSTVVPVFLETLHLHEIYDWRSHVGEGPGLWLGRLFGRN